MDSGIPPADCWQWRAVSHCSVISGYGMRLTPLAASISKSCLAEAACPLSGSDCRRQATGTAGPGKVYSVFTGTRRAVHAGTTVTRPVGGFAADAGRPGVRSVCRGTSVSGGAGQQSEARCWSARPMRRVWPTRAWPTVSICWQRISPNATPPSLPPCAMWCRPCRTWVSETRLLPRKPQIVGHAGWVERQG